MEKLIQELDKYKKFSIKSFINFENDKTISNSLFEFINTDEYILEIQCEQVELINSYLPNNLKVVQ